MNIAVTESNSGFVPQNGDIVRLRGHVAIVVTIRRIVGPEYDAFDTIYLSGTSRGARCERVDIKEIQPFYGSIITSTP